MFQDLRDVPEWFAAVFSAMVIIMTILIFTVSIMVVSHFTASPHGPRTCGASGVNKVLMGNDNTDWATLIVCNNGVALEH